MPLKRTGIFLLTILWTGLIAGCGQSPRNMFSRNIQVDSNKVGAVWEPDAPCFELPAGNYPLPDSNQAYIQGIDALSRDDHSAAISHFTTAVDQQQHTLALIFLARLATPPPGETQLTETDIYAGEWSEEMRLSVAEYYLSVAGRCQSAQDKETARAFLNQGETLLPPGSITRLPLGVARSVADIYLSDQAWESALPWLEHAASANDSSLLSLANVLYQLGRLDEAAAAYERALFYYPQRGATRYQAAQVAAARGDIPGALAILEGVENPLGLNIEILLFWAELCRQVNDAACQAEQYQRVLSIDSENSAAIEGLREIEP